jgi:hypothetical protein
MGYLIDHCRKLHHNSNPEQSASPDNQADNQLFADYSLPQDKR